MVLLNNMYSDIIISLCAGTMIAAAAYTDLKCGKVYNFITFPAMAAGLAATIACGVITGNGRPLTVGCITVALLFLFGANGWLGAGDIKLMAALALMRGTLCMILSAGVASFLVIVFEFVRYKGKTWYLLRPAMDIRRIYCRESVPFAPYLFIGYLMFCACQLMLSGSLKWV